MNQFRKYIVSFTSVLHKATYKHNLSRYGINSKTVSFEIYDKIKLDNNLREYMEYKMLLPLLPLKCLNIPSHVERIEGTNPTKVMHNHRRDDHKNTSSKNTFSSLSCYRQIWSAQDERNSIMRATSRPSLPLTSSSPIFSSFHKTNDTRSSVDH